MVKIAKKKKETEKISRKDIKEPDQFQEATTKSADWLSENRVQVAGAVLAVFILALGIYLFRVLSDGSAHAVTTELTKTLNIVEGKIEKEDKKKDATSTDPANTDEDTKTYASNKLKQEEAKKTIEQQLKAHAGKKGSLFLQLYLGHSQYQLGQYKEATESYRKFLRRLHANDSLYVLGLTSLLRAAEASKQDQEAMTALEKFIETTPNPFRPLAALRLAEYFERKKDTVRAKKYYQMLAETKTLQNLAGEKKTLSQTLTEYQSTAKRRLALLP